MRFVEYIRNHSTSPIGIFFGLLVCALAVYAPSLGVGFLSDDWHAVWVASHTENIFSFFGTNIIGERSGGTYGPIFNFFMYVQYHMFHLNAVGYHLVSIFLLVGTAWMIFKSTRYLFRNTAIACGAALLFVCMPSHVEAVTWVAGQPHLIATFFYICALYSYIVFSSEKKVRYYVGSLVSIALSLLTKEIGITFICACIVIDWWYGNYRVSQEKKEMVKNFVRIITQYIGIGMVVGVYILLRKYATGILFGYYGETSLQVSFMDSIVMGLKMTIGMFWSYPWRDNVVRGIVENSVLLYVGAIAVIGVLIGLLYRRMRAAIVVIFVYVFSLIPYLGVEYNAVSNEGERYTYLPSIFIAIGVSGLLYMIHKRFNIHNAFYGSGIVVLVAMFSYSIVHKNAEWVRAGVVVAETLPTIQELDLNPLRPVVFVGLPDRLGSAQAFRNGTFLALEMLGYGNFVGDRILVSPLLEYGYTGEKPVVRVEYCGDTTSVVCMYASNGAERIFTGLPVSEVYGVHATLEGFRRDDHRGDMIRLLKKNPDVQIIYFNYNSFQLLEG